MVWRSTEQSWGWLIKLLHWLTVALILMQWILAELAEDMPLGLDKLATLARHKSVGMTILMIAVLRLIVRATQPTPALALPAWQRLLARASHAGLYGCLLALPLTGWMMSSAKNFPVSWFGLFQWPDLVAPDEILYRSLHDWHEILFNVLMAIATLHVLGALAHHFILRDRILRRMLP